MKTKHFNHLSEAEAERLAMLIEEAGEVITAATKILRHGYERRHPLAGAHHSNREDLEREIGDFVGIYYHLIDQRDLNGDRIIYHCSVKIAKAQRYMHHFKQEKVMDDD